MAGERRGEDSNIFMKAALTGSLVFPSTSYCTSNSSKRQVARTTKPQIKMLFKPEEDLLLRSAFNKFRTDYKSVVKFMVEHRDVLPTDTSGYYSNALTTKTTERAAIERVRKRISAKFLNPRDSVDAPKSNILDGFNDDGQDSLTDEEEEEAVDQTAHIEKRRQNRYRVDTEPLEGPRDVLPTLRRKHSEERDDRTLQPVVKKQKKGKTIAEQLPGVMKTVQEAAAIHAKAMKKWEATFTAVSSSESD